METLKTQLERVQNAIAAIESGAQEYSIGSRKLTKADLQTLYKREADLITRIANQCGGSRTYAQMGTL